MLVLIYFCVLAPNLFEAIMSHEILEKVYYDLDMSDILFKKFITENNKYYTKEEYYYRLKVFEDNLKNINELNMEHSSTVFGITSFSDLTADEFESMLLNPMDLPLYETEQVDLSENDIYLPNELDYRTKNLVTEVKDQLFCGSCYIFSAIGEIEGQYAKKHNELITLSEQYPLDCGRNFSGSQDNCGGGLSQDVMKWLATTEGALKYKDYPDQLYQFHCMANSSLGVAKVNSSKIMSTYDIEALKKILVNHGPLAISLFVNSNFQLYNQGVLNPKCKANGPHNHAVVLVGYGEQGKDHYWLIKNSWGKAWGENGYIRLAMNATCSVGSYIATSEVL